MRFRELAGCSMKEFRFGTTCKFAHKCALCGGPHRRMNCSRGGEEKIAKN